MSITINQRAYEPAPEGFARRFVLDGWRGIERYYGARTDIMTRWVRECGGDRLKELRRRYMRGDPTALDEITTDADEIRGNHNAQGRIA